MEELYTEHADKITTIIINRPEKLNAFSHAMYDELSRILEDIRADSSTSVVVIKGVGRTFSAGHDLNQVYTEREPFAIPTATGDERRRGFKTLDQWFNLFWELPQPIVAQVHGYCYDAGVIMASLADVTFVADNAKISPYATPGPLGAGYFAPEFTMLVGTKRAKEIFLVLGATIDGPEAVRIGWANRTFPQTELAARTEEFAGLIARMPSDLLSLNKNAINRTAEMTGFRQAMYTGADMDTFAHFAPSVADYEATIREHGFNEAMRVWEAQFK